MTTNITVKTVGDMVRMEIGFSFVGMSAEEAIDVGGALLKHGFAIIKTAKPVAADGQSYRDETGLHDNRHLTQFEQAEREHTGNGAPDGKARK